MRVWQAVRSGLALAMLGGAGACMAPAPRLAAAPESAVALDARIFPPYNGQVAFSVNKAAHVALFEIVPGRGVSLLYPTAGSGFTQVRENWVPMQYSAQRWLYASDRWIDPAVGQWSGFDYGYGMGYAPMSARGMTRTSAPRYLFLVASEEPIEVGQFQQNLAGLRQFLGPQQYSSYQPYELMEKLAYALVPYAADERWVTDVFVDWGYDWGYGYTPGTSAAMASWQTIRCADGSYGMARWVPGWGYDAMTCAPWVNGQQSPTPGDSTSVPGQPTDDGRGRASGAGEDGRSRAGSGSTRPQLQGSQSAETRSRIARLREDATRSRFNELLNSELRQRVALRHRADELMGRGSGGAMGASGGRVSSSGNRTVRSRENARGGSQGNVRRGSSASPAPRSRASSPPRTSTQSAPSSSAPSSSSRPPRSRETSPAPSSPSPAPTRSTRSRPPAAQL